MSTEDGHKCGACGASSASKRCTSCKTVWYCGRDCQVSDWKSHKERCMAIAADIAQADSHELHKKEFDRIRTTYGLDNPQKAEQIANLLANTDANEGVSAPKFANMFGMSTEEAVVFLEWIKVGINFKEKILDNAKKAGIN